MKVPTTDLEWHTGAPLTLEVTVDGLEPGQVQEARFVCGPVTKTLGDGITASGDGTAVIVVTLTTDDLDELGTYNQARWWLRAGAAEPPVVATGLLTVLAAG